jgi:hypothetical protein
MKIATGRSFDDGAPQFDANREPGPIALVTPVVSACHASPLTNLQAGDGFAQQ